MVNGVVKSDSLNLPFPSKRILMEKKSKAPIGSDRSVQELGDWLGQFSWVWVAMLSFAYPDVSLKSAKKKLEQFLQEHGNDGQFFWVMEMHKFTGEPHFHALLGRMEKEPPKWKHGIYEIEKYDPQKGARFYIAKFLTYPSIEWDFNLPKVGR